jgi:hypothetical protein
MKTQRQIYTGTRIGRYGSRFILMKTWRSRSDPTTPMAMQNIHPGKSEPSTLMDGAPRQLVSKIRLIPAAVRRSILAVKQWPAAARIFLGLSKFMIQFSGCQVFLSSNCGPRSPEVNANAAVDSNSVARVSSCV